MNSPQKIRSRAEFTFKNLSFFYRENFPFPPPRSPLAWRPPPAAWTSPPAARAPRPALAAARQGWPPPFLHSSRSLSLSL